MSHLFLIKAPWTNKDFSFLESLGRKLSLPVVVVSLESEKRSLSKSEVIEIVSPFQLMKQKVAHEGFSLEGTRYLIVVDDWTRFYGPRFQEFRFFLLAGENPCLLLQGNDLYWEEEFLNSWTEKMSVKRLWEEACELPPFVSMTMQHNWEFIISCAPSWCQPILSWLILRQQSGNLLAWEGENKNRRNGHQAHSVSRETRHCYVDVEKWSQHFRTFLWWLGRGKKA